jgi:hypothetical protein
VATDASIGLGILLFLQPAAGSLAIIWTIAGYALVFGIVLVILGFRLRKCFGIPWRRCSTPFRTSLSHEFHGFTRILPCMDQTFVVN